MFSFAVGQWVLVCLLSGALAAVLMNIPMYVQPVGYRPAYVAAGGVTGVDPSEASDALAVAIHHITGTVAALLYGGVVFVVGSVVTAYPLNGVPAVAHLLGVASVTLFIYYFFERVAMPRAGGSLQPNATQIVQQWALSSFIYGTTLGLVVPVIVTQL